MIPLLPAAFHPIALAPTLAPNTPCIVSRELSLRTPLLGLESRHKLAITTYMGAGLGFLNARPAWDHYAVIPNYNMPPWVRCGDVVADARRLLLVILLHECNAYDCTIPAGLYFGHWDGGWAIWKRWRECPGGGWLTLPHGAAMAWLLLA